MAVAADERIRLGRAAPMTGIPLGIKDVFCVRGVPGQAASHILSGSGPEYESTVTQNLWNAGAVMLGKLNQDEFAMGSTNESSRPEPMEGRRQQGTDAGRQLMARRRRWRRTSALRRRERIRAARSASPRPSPARWG